MATNGLLYIGAVWEYSLERANRLCNIQRRSGRRAMVITYPCIASASDLDEYGRPARGYGRVYLVATRENRR